MLFSNFVAILCAVFWLGVFNRTFDHMQFYRKFLQTKLRYFLRSWAAAAITFNNLTWCNSLKKNKSPLLRERHWKLQDEKLFLFNWKFQRSMKKLGAFSFEYLIGLKCRWRIQVQIIEPTKWFFLTGPGKIFLSTMLLLLCILLLRKILQDFS